MEHLFHLLRVTGVWAPVTVLILHEFLSVKG